MFRLKKTRCGNKRSNITVLSLRIQLCYKSMRWSNRWHVYMYVFCSVLINSFPFVKVMGNRISRISFILKARSYISGSTPVECVSSTATENVTISLTHKASKTARKLKIFSWKQRENVMKRIHVYKCHTSLTDRNSSRGKTRWRSKKWAILVVRSYSAIFAPGKGKRKWDAVA